MVDTRARFFVGAMAVVGIAFLVAVVVFLIVRATRAGRVAARKGGNAQGAAQGATQGAVHPTPAATRLLGLLVLVPALLLLAWVNLSHAQQAALMAQLIYPATLAVALMLLFDKATRAWNVKPAGETAREWMNLDALVFLLVLAFLNLLKTNPGEKYNVFFWDVLNLVLFFFAFWLLDRKVTRVRFLVAHGYLVLLPILLLIWRTILDLPPPAEFAFWASLWPFFFLALIFFVLEIIVLLATRDSDNPAPGILKDAVFLALYGVLLIIAGR